VENGIPFTDYDKNNKTKHSQRREIIITVYIQVEMLKGPTGKSFFSSSELKSKSVGDSMSSILKSPTHHQSEIQVSLG